MPSLVRRSPLPAGRPRRADDPPARDRRRALRVGAGARATGRAPGRDRGGPARVRSFAATARRGGAHARGAGGGRGRPHGRAPHRVGPPRRQLARRLAGAGAGEDGARPLRHRALPGGPLGRAAPRGGRARAGSRSARGQGAAAGASAADAEPPGTATRPRARGRRPRPRAACGGAANGQLLRPGHGVSGHQPRDADDAFQRRRPDPGAAHRRLRGARPADPAGSPRACPASGP